MAPMADVYSAEAAVAHLEAGRIVIFGAGLGIPFLMQAVNLSGGTFSVESEVGKGTTFRFSFDLNNIDTPPQGDVNGAVVQAMMYDGGYELEYNKAMELVSKEIASLMKQSSEKRKYSHMYRYFRNHLSSG